MKRIYGYGAAMPISPKRLIHIRRFRPDIIHIHTEMSIGLSGIAAAKLLRKPLVYTLHTMYDDYMHYIAPPRLVRATTYFSRKYLRLLANRTNAIIGPSRKCEAYFRTIGVRKHVNVVRNAVELELFTEQPAEAEAEVAFRQQHGIAAEKTLACFVGRIGHEKNIDTLLHYWKECGLHKDAFQLIIIGDGPAKEALAELADTLGIGGSVSFIGKVAHEKLPFYYKICKIYVTASLTEAYSISMLEAMATGLPVLQLNDELNREQIQEGVNGFIFESAGEMGEKLRAVSFMDDEEYTALRHSAACSALENSPDNVTERILEIYSSIAKDAAAVR
jgi:1,2-diacylglycerol 3-alpha-glucosyltransferase